VRIESTSTGMINHVVFKGFEIDAQDPTRQVGKHYRRFFTLILSINTDIVKNISGFLKV
jgi:hypothetical protein